MLHLFKDQSEDGPTVGAKHVAGIITLYNLIKYKDVYDCIILYIFILYFTVCCILSVLWLGKICVIYHMSVILRQLLRKYPEEDKTASYRGE